MAHSSGTTFSSRFDWQWNRNTVGFRWQWFLSSGANVQHDSKL
jgi:hypothetical protein